MLKYLDFEKYNIVLSFKMYCFLTYYNVKLVKKYMSIFTQAFIQKNLEGNIPNVISCCS